VEWELVGETKVLGVNFFNHKSHMTRSGIEPGRRSGNPAIDRLNYGTAPTCSMTKLFKQRGIPSDTETKSRECTLKGRVQ
jgi:hypothetical protein